VSRRDLDWVGAAQVTDSDAAIVEGNLGLSKPAAAALSPAQVAAFYLLLGGVTLGIPLLILSLCAAARPSWNRRSARVRGSVRSLASCSVAMLLITLSALSAHLATLAPRLRDQGLYFVCEGVEGGLATGTTWPVPPCFLDHTAASTAASAAAGADPPAAEACEHQLAAAWLGYGVASLLLLLGTAGCLLHGCMSTACTDPARYRVV